jgi:type II secretory pathway pseudopilin PulG
MIEIAICLAIIGIALVAIIGVLPYGLHTQRDTREETIIDQDATVLLQAIRSGARGIDDLTNYVYAITNNRVFAGNPSPQGFSGNSLVNGEQIVGLLSTPEFTDTTTNRTPITYGEYVRNPGSSVSNHVVAYVRSISGLAAEKPPQDNAIMVGDTFSYRVLCVNAPAAVDTYSAWQSQTYKKNDIVSFILNGQTTFWQATADTSKTDVPGSSSSPWVHIIPYAQQQAASQRELRLTFMWPQLPDGNLGAFRQTFRATIAGQTTLTITNINSITYYLYFLQPQSFTSAP